MRTLTFDTLVLFACNRTLLRTEVETFCTQQGISITSWLVAHAQVIGSRFLLGTLTWDEASSALNTVWPHIVADTELPHFFFNVYLAFEDAETMEAESVRADFTRKRLYQIQLLPDDNHPVDKANVL